MPLDILDRTRLWRDRMSLSAMRWRSAVAQDESFIELMLLAAANWLSDRQMNLDRLRSEPNLIHYVAGWPRAGDMSVAPSIAPGCPSAPSGFVNFRLTIRVTATSLQKCLG